MIQPYLTPPSYKEYENSVRSSEEAYEVDSIGNGAIPTAERPQVQSYSQMSPQSWYCPPPPPPSESRTPWMSTGFDTNSTWSNSFYGRSSVQEAPPPVIQHNTSNSSTFYDQEMASSGANSISPGLVSTGLSYQDGGLSCEGCA